METVSSTAAFAILLQSQESEQDVSIQRRSKERDWVLVIATKSGEQRNERLFAIVPT